MQSLLPQSATQTWAGYMTQMYASRKPPPSLGTVDIDKLEEAAREQLKDNPSVFSFIFGGAGTHSTVNENRKEFDRWKIVPRMLRDTTVRNTEVTLFGVKYPSPLLVAPMGQQATLNAEGELGVARAASSLGIPFVMSMVSTYSIEAVAKACGNGTRWFQIYWPKSDALTESLLSRAKENGFGALVVTLDTMILGWRPIDLDTSYVPYIHGFGIQVGLTDPVFMSSLGLPVQDVDQHPDFPYLPDKHDALLLSGDQGAKQRALLSMKFISEVSSGKFRAWEELTFLKSRWDRPLILKGILSVEDAEMAINHGVSGIIISNHGGRQVDGAISSLQALHEIMQSPKVRQAQAEGKFTIMFDSGIRTGSDIIKALALGAQAVLYGRPILYALTVGGQAGAENQLRSIMADLDITLGLSGFKSLAEVHGKADKILRRASN